MMEINVMQYIVLSFVVCDWQIMRCSMIDFFFCLNFKSIEEPSPDCWGSVPCSFHRYFAIRQTCTFPVALSILTSSVLSRWVDTVLTNVSVLSETTQCVSYQLLLNDRSALSCSTSVRADISFSGSRVKRGLKTVTGIKDSIQTVCRAFPFSSVLIFFAGRAQR